MSLDLTSEQQQIRDAISRLCQRFDDNYWLARDNDGVFPEDFCRAIIDYQNRDRRFGGIGT